MFVQIAARAPGESLRHGLGGPFTPVCRAADVEKETTYANTANFHAVTRPVETIDIFV